MRPQGSSFQTLLALDKRLEQKAFLPLTPWWLEQLERFYSSKVKRFVARVGRSGIKSTTMMMTALNEALYGDWDIPKGENHFFAWISETKGEAMQRLVQIETRIRALGLEPERSGDQILIKGLNRGFRVFACQIGSVSGFRCFGFVADELSKWKTSDRSANPAAEVVASVIAMTTSHPQAKGLFVSSPWGTTDLHYQLVQEGNTEQQRVAIAPTWVANPNITEEFTHTLELGKDLAQWAREYAAIPSQGLADNWFGDAVERAVTDEPPPKHWGTRYHIAIDPAFTQDRFGYAVIASHKLPDGSRVTWVHECDSWDPRGLRPSELAGRVRVQLCDRYQQNIVYSDQHEGSSFTELCRQQGISLETIAWSNSRDEDGKTGRFKSVRNAMLEGRFRVPDSADLRREFREHYGIYGDGGTEQVKCVRSELGHGDRVSALVLGGSIALEYAAQDVEERPAEPGSPEWHALEAKRMRDRAIQKSIKRQRGDGLGRLL